MTFVVSALPRAAFESLLDLPESELAQRGVMRRQASAPNTTPCRVTLRDAEVGETVLLLNYEHQPADTPFRARHAIFVREDAQDTVFGPGAIPPAFAVRAFLSLRAFDAEGMMIDAELARTEDLETSIERLLDSPEVAYLHAHYAGAGCYAARIDRVSRKPCD
ncbi:MAG: DUF1203 domain-containing protein [Phenylobacterium sp.]|nr:DUF1203 domain-containing protein [Phenylobacterium sp.]